MNVVAINGSPRKDGNTAILIRKVFAELEREGIDTELIQLGGQTVPGCKACYACFKNRDGKCVQMEDPVNHIIARMAKADGIIIGSPVYVSDVTAEVKALIDRATLVSLASDFLFARKVGAGVAAVRRAGAIHTLETINQFFLINQMIIPGSTYWALGIGRNIGEVERDEEGMRTMTRLGQNMAWLLGKLG